MKWIFMGCIIIFLSVILSARVNAILSPQAELSVMINAVRELITDPKRSPALRQKELHTILTDRFDLREMSRRALDNHWDTTSANQEQFVSLFTRYIERLFLKYMREVRSIEVAYLVDRSVKASAYIDTKFMVKTPKSSNDYYVDFKMRFSDEKWKIFDVIVQGIRITSVFRSQFKAILEKHTFEEMLQIIERKLQPV